MRSRIIMRCCVPILLALVSLLAGCAATAPPPSAARLGLRLAPATLKENLSLQQLLHVERDGRSDDLQVALEIDAEQLTMVGLVFGQRVLTMHFDGKKLDTWRHAMLPAQVHSEDILEDIQLTYWPAEAIRQALPPGWQIEDDGLQRRLLLDGKPVMLIRYSKLPRWSGKVELSNVRYGYRLTIQSAQAAQ